LLRVQVYLDFHKLSKSGKKADFVERIKRHMSELLD
jgi:hypothetical protein